VRSNLSDIEECGVIRSCGRLRNVDQNTIVRKLSISYLQARGGRNKAFEWIVKIVIIQMK